MIVSTPAGKSRNTLSACMCKNKAATAIADPKSIINFSYTKVRNVKSPVRGTSYSAGIDFFLPNVIDKKTIEEKNGKQKHSQFNFMYKGGEMNDGYTLMIYPHSSILLPSGLHVKIPHGYMMMLANKSGIAVNKSLDICANIIDSDYQGEFCFHFINTTDFTQTLYSGDKIVQGILIPVLLCEMKEVESVGILYQNHESERGTGGFGSTGTK